MWIEATDRLIDAVVYKLYGLTDEEVEIVEKSLGRFWVVVGEAVGLPGKKYRQNKKT